MKKKYKAEEIMNKMNELSDVDLRYIMNLKVEFQENDSPQQDLNDEEENDEKPEKYLTEIIPSQLFLSGMHFKLRDLEENGVKTIVSILSKSYQKTVKKRLRSGGDLETFAEKNDIHHFCADVQDEKHELIIRHFDRIFEIVQSEKYHPVLVHCSAGVSRSSSVVIACLMRKKKMTAKKAFEYLWKKKPRVNPNSGFYRQLLIYEQEIKRK